MKNHENQAIRGNFGGETSSSYRSSTRKGELFAPGGLLRKRRDVDGLEEGTQEAIHEAVGEAQVTQVPPVNHLKQAKREPFSYCTFIRI